MEKIQSLKKELEQLKKGLDDEKKYNFEFKEIQNRQVNFQSKGVIPAPFVEFVKKFNNIFEAFINLTKESYDFTLKMKELKEIKTNIINILNDYLQVLKDNETNFQKIEDENINKKFMNCYKRLNIDLVDKFKSLSDLFKELYTNIINFADGLKKKKETYENYGKEVPKGDDQNKNDKFKSIIYKTFRNVEELIEFIGDTLREIKKTKKEWIDNKNQFERRIDKIVKDFPNANINVNEIRGINEKIVNLMDKFKNFEINIQKSDFPVNRQNMRLDILLIVDTTYTMSSYVENLKDGLKEIIKSIRNDFPLTVVKTGFIGYKDFEDLELGDDYIDIDLSINDNKLIENIEKIEPDGGEKEPKDVAGAFKLAIEKNWGQGKKLAILITNSPCHGNEYNDSNEDTIQDGYKDTNNPDFERKKINEYLKEFIKDNIYLIGYKISDKTNKMYNKFKEFYDSENAQALFSEEIGKLNNIIYNKVKGLLKDQIKEVINIQ